MTEGDPPPRSSSTPPEGGAAAAQTESTPQSRVLGTSITAVINALNPAIKAMDNALSKGASYALMLVGGVIALVLGTAPLYDLGFNDRMNTVEYGIAIISGASLLITGSVMRLLDNKLKMSMTASATNKVIEVSGEGYRQLTETALRAQQQGQQMPGTGG